MGRAAVAGILGSEDCARSGINLCHLVGLFRGLPLGAKNSLYNGWPGFPGMMAMDRWVSLEFVLRALCLKPIHPDLQSRWVVNVPPPSLSCPLHNHCILSLHYHKYLLGYLNPPTLALLTRPPK